MLALTRPSALVAVAWVAVCVGVSACGSASKAAHSSPAPVRPSPPTAATAAPSSRTDEPAPWCTRAELALVGPLPGFGGITGEHELTYAVRNTGAQNCSLEGYPTVELYDPRLMPFVYDNTRPANPFLSTSVPTRVELAAHAQAYFQVAKYRCDLGESKFAASMHIALPNSAGAFRVDLSPPMTPSRSLWWCTGQTHDPGNVVNVSPIRSTAGQLPPQP